MRCYFVKDGHIVAVEELFGLTDDEAIEKSHSLFEQRKDVEGFEVWDMARIVFRYPDPDIAAEPVRRAS